MEIVLDVSALVPDLTTIDALARLRLRQPIRLCGASRELRELIDFCGLAEVLRVDGTPRLQRQRDPGGGR
jgi:hypothetical protein